MVMRLLSKQEINTHKALEKKQQIDEGVKLARKVDNLRELAADEDAALQKFRNETVAAINAEISTLSEHKIALMVEVSQLADARAAALKPIDAEIAVLNQTKADVVEAQRAMRSTAAQLSGRSYEIDDREREVEARENKVEAFEEQAEENYGISVSAREDAEDELAIVKRIRENADEKVATITQELHEREVALLGRERDIEGKEKSIAAQQKTLNEKEREVEDRYQTLLRTEQRIYGRRK